MFITFCFQVWILSKVRMATSRDGLSSTPLYDNKVIPLLQKPFLTSGFLG